MSSSEKTRNLEWDDDLDGKLKWLEFYDGPHTAYRERKCEKRGPNGSQCHLVEKHPGDQHAVISLSGLVVDLWPRASTVSDVELDAKKHALYVQLTRVRDDVDSAVSNALMDYRVIIDDIRALKGDTAELLNEARHAQDAVDSIDLMEIGPSDDEEDWV